MSLMKIDMTHGAIETKPFPKDKIIGGKAIVDYLMTEYCSPLVHPLSEKSVFIVAPGLLAGTGAPQSGRISIGGKSPLTGGIKEANAGGTVAHKLGRLGIRSIMVEGKAQEWQILKVDKKGASLMSAEDVVGLTNYDACSKLHERYGDDVGIIIIGPAGEMKLSNSTVGVTDPEGRPSRHAARGGLGAVMGAKGLKAIVIDDSGGIIRKAVDKEAFKSAVKEATKAIKTGPVTDPLHQFGTAMFVDSDNARGSMPTNNHRLGTFDKFENINASKFIELNKTRGGTNGHGCMPGCIVRCSTMFNDSSGEHVTSALEYETIAMLGSNLGIDDLDAIARMDRKCDEIGVDTIEIGCAIGILNDVGLYNFGDVVKAETLLEEVAQGTPMGRVIGSGVVATAQVYGIDRVPAVKGQGIPAHSARSMKGWGVTYATSPQGADHSAGAVGVELLSAEGHGERSRVSQINMAALDSTGLCWFTFIMGAPEIIVPMINAFYGVNWTEEEYFEMGKEMLRQELAFNSKAGVAPDGLPDWMRNEPLGPTNAVFDVSQADIDGVFDF